MANILLITTLGICLTTDLKKRKIYNAVLMPALILGFLLNLYSNGMVGLLVSVKGMALGLGLLIVPYILGGVAAGDVKFLATIGAIKGTQFALYAFFGMALVGGLMSILVLLTQKRFIKTIKNLFKGLWVMAYTMGKVTFFDNTHEKNMIPYGVAIVGGAIYALIMVG